jgi:hypothetical protein
MATIEEATDHDYRPRLGDDGTTGLEDGVLENWSGGRMCTEIKEICRRLDEKDGRECFLPGWGVHFGVTAGVNQCQPVTGGSLAENNF